MRYSNWTDKNWQSLISRCRADGVTLTDEEIREAAFGYMTHGADGGGNRYGILGTVVALNVDKVGADA